MQYLTGETKVI